MKNKLQFLSITFFFCAIIGFFCAFAKYDPKTTPAGYVYVLSNPAYVGIYKIGLTRKTPEARAAELYTTGVLYPFKIEYVHFSADAGRLERAVHKKFEAVRVNPKREFFRADTAQIIDVIISTDSGMKK